MWMTQSIEIENYMRLNKYNLNTEQNKFFYGWMMLFVCCDDQIYIFYANKKK